MRVLRRAGYEVRFPAGQTCCGQPAWNSGFPDEARRVAGDDARGASRRPTGPIVGLSGSCVATVHHVWPELFRADVDAPRPGARRLAARARARRVPGRRDGCRAARPAVRARSPSTARATSAASSARQPRARAARRDAAASSTSPLPQEELCCGFGGTFSVKFPQVSGAMGLDKARSVVDVGGERARLRRPRLPAARAGLRRRRGNRADDDDARRVPRPRGLSGVSGAVFEGDAGLDARLDEALARPQLARDARVGAAHRARWQAGGARASSRLGRSRRPGATYPHGRRPSHGRAARHVRGQAPRERRHADPCAQRGGRDARGARRSHSGVARRLPRRASPWSRRRSG